jgi:hypothetical protein
VGDSLISLVPLYVEGTLRQPGLKGKRVHLWVGERKHVGRDAIFGSMLYLFWFPWRDTLPRPISSCGQALYLLCREYNTPETSIRLYDFLMMYSCSSFPSPITIGDAEFIDTFDNKADITRLAEMVRL